MVVQELSMPHRDDLIFRAVDDEDRTADLVNARDVGEDVPRQRKSELEWNSVDGEHGALEDQAANCKALRQPHAWRSADGSPVWDYLLPGDPQHISKIEEGSFYVSIDRELPAVAAAHTIACVLICKDVHTKPSLEVLEVAHDVAQVLSVAMAEEQGELRAFGLEPEGRDPLTTGCYQPYEIRITPVRCWRWLEHNFRQAGTHFGHGSLYEL
mmetsp:Transcript_70515/g.168905  ORF Transcript_70515/g.168905 Transcript_70515/m.168905 type:complete len:212 (-) Transcript_70515:176-811(-)